MINFQFIWMQLLFLIYSDWPGISVTQSQDMWNTVRTAACEWAAGLCYPYAECGLERGRLERWWVHSSRINWGWLCEGLEGREREWNENVLLLCCRIIFSKDERQWQCYVREAAKLRETFVRVKGRWPGPVALPWRKRKILFKWQRQSEMTLPFSWVTREEKKQ